MKKAMQRLAVNAYSLARGAMLGIQGTLMSCRLCGATIPLKRESPTFCARCLMIAQLIQELVRKHVCETVEAEKRVGSESTGHV